jgi:uncharacterized protein involved in exopolysaccharide biosynthesis
MTILQFRRTLVARRWTILFTVAALFVVLGAVVLMVPACYTAVASVVVGGRPDDSLIGALSQVPAGSNYVATQADVIASPRVARRVASTLKLDQDPDLESQWRRETDGRGNRIAWLGDQLLAQLKVRLGRESNVIEIQFNARDPVLAADLANAFAQAYLDTHLELQGEPAPLRARLFDTRARQLRDELQQAEGNLAQAEAETADPRGGAPLDSPVAAARNTVPRLAQLQAELEAQRRHVAAMSAHGDDVSALERQVEAAQTSLDLLMLTERLSLATLEDQPVRSDAALLTPATEPAEPTFPRLRMYGALTLVLGLIVGAALALLAEFFNPMVHGPSDITRRIGIPVFAVVPHNKLNRRVLPQVSLPGERRAQPRSPGAH